MNLCRVLMVGGHCHSLREMVGFLRKYFAALFVLTSRGWNLSVFPGEIMMMTVPSWSNISSREVVVSWLVKLSISAIAFSDGVPISSLTFLTYAKMIFWNKWIHVSSLSQWLGVWKWWILQETCSFGVNNQFFLGIKSALAENYNQDMPQM